MLKFLLLLFLELFLFDLEVFFKLLEKLLFLEPQIFLHDFSFCRASAGASTARVDRSGLLLPRSFHCCGTSLDGSEIMLDNFTFV